MPGLQLSKVSRSFGGRDVLHGVDLQVARGEIVGFIGGNGAGKTTTMRLILGLLTPTGGQINWDGAPITAQDRRSIGYMPEERGLYPDMTVQDQLEHFALLEGHSLPEARTVAAELIDAVGLQGREHSRIQDLSLGNQQRVQLGVALAGNPVLLVLDEPFSGLDPLAVETMAELIREQAARGVGVLFSSHQLELVERLCDSVCVLDRGKVVANGKVAELQTDGSSHWQLNFAGPVPGLFAAEVALIEGLTPTLVDGDDAAVLITVDGANQPIPAEVLKTASRHGGLRSIEQVCTSLADILADRLVAAQPPSATATTAEQDRQLVSIGAAR